MRCFSVFKSKLEARLDPTYVYEHRSYLEGKAKYAVRGLGSLLAMPPQYGANESATGGNPETDYRYVRITDVDEFGNLRKDGWKTAEKIDKKYILEEGDVLFARSGATAGKTYIYSPKDGKAIFAGYMIRFRFDRKKVDPLFVFFYTQLNRYEQWVALIQRPAGQPNINSEEFKALEIPVPDPKVQKQVIGIMNCAYAEKQRREQEADDLLVSIDGYILDQLMIKRPSGKPKKIYTISSKTVSAKRLDPLYYAQEILSFIEGLDYDHPAIDSVVQYMKTGFAAGKGDQELENLDESIIQIRPTNMSDTRELIFTKNIRINRAVLNEKPDAVLKKGEVLFNNTNSQDLVGKTVYFDEDGEFVCSNHVTRIKTKSNDLDGYYLYCLLNLYQRLGIFYSICTNWNNQSGVNADLLASLPIPKPDKKKQKEIAGEVKNRMAKAAALKKQALEKLNRAKAEVEGILFGSTA